MAKWSDERKLVSFRKADTSGDGLVDVEELVNLVEKENIGLSRPEARRLFTQFDLDGNGALDECEWLAAMRKSSLFKTIASELSDGHPFAVPKDFNFADDETWMAYSHPQYNKSDQTSYDEALHGPLVGEYASIRRTLVDYSYHPVYTEERQRWQDGLVKSIVESQKPDDCPWLIFTCGAMGAGKGHVISWLSHHDIFPVESLVRIDPDNLKSRMPEWGDYVKADKANGTTKAGGMCHRESGFIQELCLEAALQSGSHTWVDGSLQAHDFYRDRVFAHVRKNYPHYKIALFYVYADLEEVKTRAQKRGEKTGRFIDTSYLEKVFYLTQESSKILGPLSDYMLEINNNGRVPVLDVVRDHTHSWQPVRSRFTKDAVQDFPRALAPMTFQTHACSGSCMTFRPACLDNSDGVTRVALQSMLNAEGLERYSQIQMYSPTIVFSNSAPMTLDCASREMLGLPQDATTFAFCYGVQGTDNTNTESLYITCPDADFSDPIVRFLMEGGFAYFGQDGEALCVAVSTEHGSVAEGVRLLPLHFGMPVTVPKPVEEKLASRWMACVDAKVVNHDGVARAWLTPDEHPLGSHGGMAYQVAQPDGSTKSVFFPVAEA